MPSLNPIAHHDPRWGLTDNISLMSSEREFNNSFRTGNTSLKMCGRYMSILTFQIGGRSSITSLHFQRSPHPHFAISLTHIKTIILTVIVLPLLKRRYVAAIIIRRHSIWFCSWLIRLTIFVRSDRNKRSFVFEGPLVKKMLPEWIFLRSSRVHMWKLFCMGIHLFFINYLNIKNCPQLRSVSSRKFQFKLFFVKGG